MSAGVRTIVIITDVPPSVHVLMPMLMSAGALEHSHSSEPAAAATMLTNVLEQLKELSNHFHLSFFPLAQRKAKQRKRGLVV